MHSGECAEGCQIGLDQYGKESVYLTRAFLDY
jgi:hypothetical protein